MRALMIAAMQSGAGKTVLACALMRSLQRRGLGVAGFKCGPDYLDPLFHRRVLGAPAENLDLFLQGATGVRRTLASSRTEVAVVEGAMGLFDGIAGTDEASAWQLAARENLPVILAVRPQGSSLTLAAQVRGIQGFRTPNMVAGILLVACKPSLAAHLKPMLERECEVPVLGFLPPMEEARFASRHLGLVAADEIPDFQRRIDAVAQQLERTCDLDLALSLAGHVANEPPKVTKGMPHERMPRIAVARDEAFCFYYECALARLKACGVQLVPFSPLHDAELPAVDGLYVGGGYPELHAAELGANTSMLRTIRDAVADGMPTVAECGGFMLLQESLVDPAGHEHAMAGALPGRSAPAGGLVRFGYAHLTTQSANLLLRPGERMPVHEFHHWDATNNGSDLTAIKPDGRTWRCCHATETLYAGFPHIHLAGQLPLAQRFVNQARRFGSTS